MRRVPVSYLMSDASRLLTYTVNSQFRREMQRLNGDGRLLFPNVCKTGPWGKRLSISWRWGVRLSTMPGAVDDRTTDGP